MARVYSDISKFKRPESDLRRVTRDLAGVVEKIGRAEAGRLSNADAETLAKTRAEWIGVHDVAKRALANFWDRVEGTE